MKIEQMDRAAAKQIGEAVEEALQMVAEDLGLEVEVRGGRFDSHVGTYAPKITFGLGGAEQRAFESIAALFEMQPEDYGAEFTANGQTYKLVGLNPRAPKYPAICEDPSGARLRFTDHVLRQVAAERLKREKAAG